MLRIRELRESRHLSQQRLASEVNITQESISKYELGRAEPSIDMIKSLAKYFGVSTDYLLGVSDNKLNVSADGLSEKERKLLFDFKRLDAAQKEKLLAYLQGLLQE